MTEQLALPLAPLVTPEYAEHLTIAERFAAFHAANPHVADLLESLAAEWLGAGHKRVGVKQLVEQARWVTGVQTTGAPWKLDNTLTAHYARLLIERRPEWAEAIQTRELRAA